MKGAYASDLRRLLRRRADASRRAGGDVDGGIFKSTVAARGGAPSPRPTPPSPPPGFKIGAKEAAKLARRRSREAGVVVPTAMEAPVPEPEKVA